MKTRVRLITAAGTLPAAFSAAAQGTFVYDQQSATNQGIVSGDGGFGIQQAQPMGQSFTPSSLSGLEDQKHCKNNLNK
jgi:hypothetical protein